MILEKPKNVRDVPDKHHPWKVICVTRNYGESVWSVYANQKKAIAYATHLSNRYKSYTFRVEKHPFL
jgi:hypothetical protein